MDHGFTQLYVDQFTLVPSVLMALVLDLVVGFFRSL